MLSATLHLHQVVPQIGRRKSFTTIFVDRRSDETTGWATCALEATFGCRETFVRMLRY